MEEVLKDIVFIERDFDYSSITAKKIPSYFPIIFSFQNNQHNCLSIKLKHFSSFFSILERYKIVL